jgi:hypothetical protein
MSIVTFVATSGRCRGRRQLGAVLITAAGGLLAAHGAAAQGQVPGRPALFQKHVGSPDYPALLKEPAVHKSLQQVVGKHVPALLRNVNVTGDMEFVGGAIVIAGNAPHKGGEEEAVICVDPRSGAVQAALFSKGRITVFAKEARYDYLTLCVKDWITQVNSGHRDRFTQPKNVQFGKAN